jgi:hypothetical protein
MTAARLVLPITLLAMSCDPELGELRARDAPATAEPSTSDAGTSADGGVVAVRFARDIRPILNRTDGPPAGCKRCHYPISPAPQGFQIGGLDLSTLGSLRRGGVSSGRTVVVPFDPDGSVIVQKLEGTYSRGARMPKDLTPLSRAEIDLIRRWIAEGAVGSDDE